MAVDAVSPRAELAGRRRLRVRSWSPELVGLDRARSRNHVHPGQCLRGRAAIAGASDSSSAFSRAVDRATGSPPPPMSPANEVLEPALTAEAARPSAEIPSSRRCRAAKAAVRKTASMPSRAAANADGTPSRHASCWNTSSSTATARSMPLPLGSSPARRPVVELSLDIHGPRRLRGRPQFRQRGRRLCQARPDYPAEAVQWLIGAEPRACLSSAPAPASSPLPVRARPPGVRQRSIAAMLARIGAVAPAAHAVVARPRTFRSGRRLSTWSSRPRRPLVRPRPRASRDRPGAPARRCACRGLEQRRPARALGAQDA